MEFTCTNEECAKYNEVVSFKQLTAIVVDGSVKYKQAHCEKCGDYMSDVTEHDGYGKAFKAKGDRSRAYYNRGKSQNVHK